MKSFQYRKLTRAFIYLAASVPLLQVTCATDALRQSLTNEVTNSASQFVFEAAQTIFMNLFRL